MGWLSWSAIGIVSLLALGILIIMIAARSAPRPEGLGIVNGRLATCRTPENCVSSQDGMLEPFTYESSQESARKRLQEIVLSMPGVAVVTDENNYLAVTFRSRFFGFIDDVEFQLSTQDRIIHFRSGARQGRSDFNVNRTRIEAIRAEFVHQNPE